MSDQLVLDVGPFVPVKGETLQERFDAFAEAHPWFEAAVVRIARDAQRRGKTRIGMKMIFELIRWEYERVTDESQPWAVNNSYTSRYTRLVCAKYPDLAPMFQTRALKTAA